jgi:hypothetical protein
MSQDESMDASALNLGDRVLVTLSAEEGVMIAPAWKPSWTKYHDSQRKSIPVFSIQLDSGEVRFYVAEALERISGARLTIPQRAQVKTPVPGYAA